MMFKKAMITSIFILNTLTLSADESVSSQPIKHEQVLRQCKDCQNKPKVHRDLQGAAEKIKDGAIDTFNEVKDKISEGADKIAQESKKKVKRVAKKAKKVAHKAKKAAKKEAKKAGKKAKKL